MGELREEEERPTFVLVNRENQSYLPVEALSWIAEKAMKEAGELQPKLLEKFGIDIPIGVDLDQFHSSWITPTSEIVVQIMWSPPEAVHPLVLALTEKLNITLFEDGKLIPPLAEFNQKMFELDERIEKERVAKEEKADQIYKSYVEHWEKKTRKKFFRFKKRGLNND